MLVCCLAHADQGGDIRNGLISCQPGSNPQLQHDSTQQGQPQSYKQRKCHGASKSVWIGGHKFREKYNSKSISMDEFTESIACATIILSKDDKEYDYLIEYD